MLLVLTPTLALHSLKHVSLFECMSFLKTKKPVSLASCFPQQHVL